MEMSLHTPERNMPYLLHTCQTKWPAASHPQPRPLPLQSSGLSSFSASLPPLQCLPPPTRCPSFRTLTPLPKWPAEEDGPEPHTQVA
ncbi:hypothetical protein E2C01_044084 [Portunus trituberculatus]|uniref:Uncharacterized protein n=1 Tax=Portunus trituberculatus TaxID=210409 RepID=A0A5B7FS72_PORTR|nr:hypothetical protein [Portunus trituberculatus]